MTCAVCSTPSGLQPFLLKTLAEHVLDVVTSGRRAYVFFLVHGSGDDMTFTDPIDGMLLVEYRLFADETSARTWVAEDIALRAGGAAARGAMSDKAAT